MIVTLDDYARAFAEKPINTFDRQEKERLFAKLTQWQREGFTEVAYGGGGGYNEDFRVRISVLAWVGFAKNGEVVIYSRKRQHNGSFNMTGDWQEKRYTTEEFVKWAAHHELYPRIQLAEFLSRFELT